MSNERRKFPRVDIGGEVNIQIAGVIRNGKMINLSPSGIQISTIQIGRRFVSGF